MTSENYIGLSVVSGFFVGLIFAFASFSEPEFIVLVTIVVTTIFYLIAIFAISFFNWFVDFEARNFNKKVLENNLEYYVEQFGKKKRSLCRF